MPDQHGISNGADWYVLEGGAQDFNYIFSNCMELTVEISCCKYPPAPALQYFWDVNRESILSTIEMVHKLGIKGIVTDQVCVYARSIEPLIIGFFIIIIPST